MNPEHERELWEIRFKRVVELEQESYEFYQKLLKEKPELLEEAGIKSTLKEILRDEGRHIRIAKDLLRLVS
ncbi:MAG: hypothetical protein Q8Q97_02520 [bacterium]|nr:hypothetical protein [bacterium]